jgi:hypothetical protein
MNILGNGAPVVGAAEVASRQKQSEPAMMDGLSSSKVTGTPAECWFRLETY